MLEKKELQLIGQAVVVSSVMVGLLNGVYLSGIFPQDGMVSRLLILLGGNFIKGGYIQWLTYLAFFWSISEIKALKAQIKAEKSYFKANLLPTDEKHLLMSDDVVQIGQKVKDFEKKYSKTLLTQLIKNSCAKFRSTKNVSEVLEVINIITDLHRDNSETEQSNIRYLLWAIPSLGFIGTVLGISSALMLANSKDMQLITSTLGVAFDTTLVALILSIILMWLFHDLQKATDQFHMKTKEYVIENLVNKIEM
ncbi:MotA/TolQ/ExbB proton channel family protein [Halobacteriovorax sp. GFR7]|uniref:MotA/TolQ/ExbB proton channel family protein n=1 Tax=unclassified Halobacteriovorax TaxID=2639665 RepID=UPI0037136322